VSDKKKILVIQSIHKAGIDLLENHPNFDFEVIENLDTKNIISKISECDALSIRTAKLPGDLINNSKKLQIISRHGVGYDNIDIDYLNKNQIALGITGTSNAVSVSEHVLTMFLYLAKKIYISNNLTKEGKFNQRNNIPDFFELYKKNILICGFGRIGKEVAKRCNGFDSKVYVYDPFVNINEIHNNNCYPINKNEGLKIADYITIHLPLDNKTKNFISFEEFKNLKKNTILVNTARGGIINEDALYIALKENKISGAGLDVFENEPPSENHPLFSLQNIILSPHNAALTLECRKRMAIESCENIDYFLTKNKNLNKNNIIIY